MKDQNTPYCMYGFECNNIALFNNASEYAKTITNLTQQLNDAHTIIESNGVLTRSMLQRYHSAQSHIDLLIRNIDDYKSCIRTANIIICILSVISIVIPILIILN